MLVFRKVLLLFNLLLCVNCLNNGLSRTPPMGWMSWTKFYCQIDCLHHPLACINEQLYMDMADRMAADGYLAAGYEYVHIDDCWLEKKRDASGKMVADKQRFPHGIKWLADYVHSKGLKLGLYEDYGNKTCAGYPGSQFFLKTDAETFASWGVDYLKLDGCNVDGGTAAYARGYPEMSHQLNATGRPIAYSCSWPAYLDPEKPRPYATIAKYCNLWRNYNDISRSWKSIQSIINYYDRHQDDLIAVNGPGHWNDPDMIIVGNLELTVDQSQAQMAIWSIWSAPLIMSNDLRFLAPAYKAILQNKKVIAIDQDPMGIMGRLIFNGSDVGVYRKPVIPFYSKTSQYSYAIAFLNRNLNKTVTAYVAKLMDIGLNNTQGYYVEDLFTGQKYGLLKPASNFTARVNATGVVFIKATVAQTVKGYRKKEKVVDYYDYNYELIDKW